MRKPFNLRLPVLFAVSFCGGILFSTVLAYFGLSETFILIPPLAAFIVCIPLAVIKRGAAKAFIAIIAGLLFLIGAIALYALYLSYGVALGGEAARVSGRVERVGTTSGGTNYLLLSNVTVNGRKISGKIAAYMTENAVGSCRRGYIVEFTAPLEEQSFFEYDSISYNASRGVKYICTVAGYKATYRFDLFGEINYAVERALFNHLDGETAAVCFALLTGNTEAISAGTLTAFRNGGIAHVFAVSGLHIGVVYGGLTFVFKKLRFNRVLSAVLRILILFFYSGVCLFSASSVRALVMCSVAALSRCFYRKGDSLNSLALAAIILLAVNPLNLYGAGFALSFAAVLGILLLSGNLKRLLSFLPHKIAETLSVGVSVQFSTVPVQLTSFGYISAAGLLLNMVFIPVISVLYVLLLICTFAAVIIPVAAGVFLTVASAPLQLITALVAACGFENAIISGNFSDFIYLPFILTGLTLTDKINFSLRRRIACFCAFSAFVCLSPAVPNAGGDYATVVFSAGYSGGCVSVTTQAGTVLVVTENFDKRSETDCAADVLVVLGVKEGLTAVTGLDGGYGVIYMQSDAFPLLNYDKTPVIYTDEFTACGINFTFDGNALTAEIYSARISLVYGEGNHAAGEMQDGLGLYCFGNKTAVLYAGGRRYGLNACGDIEYEITRAGSFSTAVVLKE